MHRDVKPANIMLNWDLPSFEGYQRLDDFSKALNLNQSCLQVKLGDFGFSRFVTPTQFASSCLGSPVYMAPEVLKASCGCEESTNVRAAQLKA
jgi:serine/threonine protein kinase